MPVSAFNIEDINTITINGTATDMTTNGTHFWVADDSGSLNEFDIDFNPTFSCSVNQSANNFVTYIWYDNVIDNATLFGGEFSPDFNGWTLQRSYWTVDPSGPLVKCDINRSGTWISTRLYSGDSWYYNTTEDSNIGQWNAPLIAAAQYHHFWLNRTSLTTTRIESAAYPNFTSVFNPGAILVTADKYNAATPVPISIFVSNNETGVGGQIVHKYTAISFAPIDYNLQYLIDIDIDYPDIDRIMAMEFLQNGSDKWLYMINNTHAWRIDINEFEALVVSNVSLLSPLDGDILTISEVTAKYNLQIIDNVTANVFLDGLLFNSRSFSDVESGNYFEAFGNLSSDTHIWGVQLLNQSNSHEFGFPNATFTIQLSGAEEVAGGIRSALGLPDIQSGLSLLAILLVIALSIGAGVFAHSLGGSGDGAVAAFLLVFIGSSLVFGSIGWLPTWITIMLIVMGGFIVAMIFLKGFGGLTGG